MGLINGIHIALTILPELKSDFFLTLDELNKNYDPNLEIIWADNQLEINQEYVYIYWPSIINYKYFQLPHTFALINNSDLEPQEASQLNDMSTLIYLNNDNFYTLSDIENHEWSSFPLNTILDGLSSFSINKQNLPKLISGLKDGVNKIFFQIQIVEVLFAIPIFIFSKFWLLLSESILVYFLFKIYNFNFNFKKILKLNLNILVPTSIITLFANVFVPRLSFPIESIAFWVILIFISFQLKKVD